MLRIVFSCFFPLPGWVGLALSCILTVLQLLGQKRTILIFASPGCLFRQYFLQQEPVEPFLHQLTLTSQPDFITLSAEKNPQSEFQFYNVTRRFLAEPNAFLWLYRHLVVNVSSEIHFCGDRTKPQHY